VSEAVKWVLVGVFVGGLVSVAVGVAWGYAEARRARR
jgi:hypothetical protein